MNIKKITIETDEGIYTGSLSFTPTLPPPPPILPKWVLLNVINWAVFSDADFNDISEATYFVLPVSKEGNLLGTSDATEKTFVNLVHSKGKKVTFSVAGGSQNIPDITTAVTINSLRFIQQITTHIKQYNYDGVTLDIENTNITSNAMVDFVRFLRIAMDNIKPGLIIGIYTQPFQLNNVWSRIGEVAKDFNWLSPMMYDRGPYNKEQWTADTNAWLPRVGGDKSKLLYGLSPNYGAAGTLNELQYADALDTVNKEGWGGVGIWEHSKYRQSFRDVQRAKFPHIS